MTDYRALAAEIYQSNIAAGWWPENRNRGEVMMLIVSELAEAAEGLLTGAPDDKLPYLPMFDVELADTAIRLFDLIGADAIDAPIPQVSHFSTMQGGAGRLMYIVCAVAAAMEGHRKGNTVAYAAGLWRALMLTYLLAATHEIDLDDVIARKRAFNAVRADHKPEARSAAGGKRY